MTRLDKYLSQSGEYSRSEAARAVRSGRATLDGTVVRDPAAHVPQGCEIRLDGQVVHDRSMQYYMLNKPAGVLTAARDSRAATVMSLVPPALLRRGVLPVGRLDKDTTGLLLLTNDGALAHALLSPKRHVWKRYLLTVTGRLTQDDVRSFLEGVPLKDFTAKPARLAIIEAADNESRAEVELREGKFHQIKRMCLARGHEVLALKRVAFGSLELDAALAEGGWRELTGDETEALRRCARADESEAEHPDG